MHSVPIPQPIPQTSIYAPESAPVRLHEPYNIRKRPGQTCKNHSRVPDLHATISILHLRYQWRPVATRTDSTARGKRGAKEAGMLHGKFMHPTLLGMRRLHGGGEAA